MALPALQSAAAALLSSAPPSAAEQRLVHPEAVARRPVGVVQPPVWAARLQEEALQLSEGPAGSAQLSEAAELLPHAPAEAAVAPASTSQPALGVGETPQVASLQSPPRLCSV